MILTNLSKRLLLILFLSGTMFHGFAQTDAFRLLVIHKKCGNIISSEENHAYHLFSEDGFQCAFYLLKNQSDILAVVGLNDTIRLNRQQLLDMYHKIDTGEVVFSSELESVCSVDTTMEVITAAEWLGVREQQADLPVEIDTSSTPRLFIQTGIDGSIGASRFGKGVLLSAHYKSGKTFVGVGGIWAMESRKYDVPTIFSSGPQTEFIYRYRSLFAYYGRSIQVNEAIFNLSCGLSWENIITKEFEVRPHPTLISNEEIVETSSEGFNGPGLVVACQIWLFPRAAFAPGLNLQTSVNKKYTTVSVGLTLRLGRINPRKIKH